MCHFKIKSNKPKLIHSETIEHQNQQQETKVAYWASHVIYSFTSAFMPLSNTTVVYSHTFYCTYPQIYTMNDSMFKEPLKSIGTQKLFIILQTYSNLYWSNFDEIHIRMFSRSSVDHSQWLILSKYGGEQVCSWYLGAWEEWVPYQLSIGDGCNKTTSTRHCT